MCICVLCVRECVNASSHLCWKWGGGPLDPQSQLRRNWKLSQPVPG